MSIGLAAGYQLHRSAASINEESAAYPITPQAHLAIAAQYCICLPSAHRGFQPSTHNSCFLSFLFLARLQQVLRHLRQISARRQSCTGVCWCSCIVRHVPLPLCIFFLSHVLTSKSHSPAFLVDPILLVPSLRVSQHSLLVFRQNFQCCGMAQLLLESGSQQTCGFRFFPPAWHKHRGCTLPS